MSLVRGLGAVAGSVHLLVSTFLALFVVWAGLTAYLRIIPVSPATLVLALSLPPLRSFLDLQYLNAGATTSSTLAVAFGVGAILIRAALSAWWISLILERLQQMEAVGGASSAGAVGHVAAARARATRMFVPLIGLEAAYLLLAILAQIVATGFLGALGQFGVLAVLVGGLYLLVYVPIAMVVERVGLRPAARLSVRAARVPGPRHMLMTFGYLAVTLVLSSSSPASRAAQATPSIAVWSYVLFISFLHVAALAAFVYRWLLLREHMDVDAIVEEGGRSLFGRRRLSARRTVP